MRRLHANIRGQVQGVGFRYYVRNQAQRLGLAGWVRNRPDGAVELEAEGDPVALDRLVEALRQGPSLAAVEQVDLDWSEVPPRFARFEIVG